MCAHLADVLSILLYTKSSNSYLNGFTATISASASKIIHTSGAKIHHRFPVEQSKSYRIKLRTGRSTRTNNIQHSRDSITVKVLKYDLHHLQFHQTFKRTVMFYGWGISTLEKITYQEQSSQA